VAEFRILGPLRVTLAGRELPIVGHRQRRLLAALLLGHGRPVPIDRLVAATWDGTPPATAQRLVRNLVAQLRARLTRSGALIDTAGTGYQLRLRPGELDADAFADLAQRGRADSDPTVLRRALRLWRGPALADVRGTHLRERAAVLDEERLTVWEDCLELELAGDRADDALPELEELVARHPLRERLVGMLMVALQRTGRTTEAAQVYRELADRLAEELGIDPSPALRRLHDAVYRKPQRFVPAQLPADIRAFTGRHADLAALDRLIANGQSGTAPMIATIVGTPGVGKTALAVHWAHRVRDKFPDGQLYVNLRGFDPGRAALSPAIAVRRFLDGFGLPAAQIPVVPAAQSELYQRLLAERRVLVVLDNARDADQVRPLLPEAPGSSLVLVTSRHQLTGLAGEPIRLDLLTPAEAREMLIGRLDKATVTAAPDAVADIIRYSARLPLALAVAAARHPDHPLDRIAAELHEARGRLDPFAGDDAASDVRAVLSWSYRALTPAAARMFRLLSPHPGADLAVPAAASLAGVPCAEAAAALAELTAASLVAEHHPGRYTFHDLLRAYATEQIRADECADAVRRLLDHYLHTALAAELQLTKLRSQPTPPAAADGIVVTGFDDTDAALEWLAVHLPILLAAIDLAADGGYDAHAWQLAWALGTFLGRQGRWQEWVDTHVTALAAARRTGAVAGEADTRHSLAAAYTRLGRFAAAHDELRAALVLYERLGDRIGQARAHQGHAFAYDREGRHDRALHHSEASVEVLRAADHPVVLAYALNAVGWCHTQLGNHREALRWCGESLAEFEKLDDLLGQAGVLDSLGTAHHRLGGYPAAVEYYERSVRIGLVIGDREQAVLTLDRLGDTCLAAGWPDRARDAWRRCLEIGVGLRDPCIDAARAKLRGLDT
jgi:DNA-binding SARP family transcriptional activator/tetratricopeptide (TPR) repeat protein